MNINQEHVRRFLCHMHNFRTKKGIPYKTLQSRILEESKQKRSQLSWDEHEAKGINIYPKAGVTVAKICDYAQKNKWIKEVGESWVLTAEGKQKYYNILTNNHCQAYLQYEKTVFHSFDEKKMVRPDSIHIMESFSKGHTVESLMEWASEPNELGLRSKEHYQQVLEALGYAKEELDDYLIFQFVPQLFLPHGEEKAVELEIRGIEQPANFRLSKPYPNKRYVVGGLNLKTMKTHTGFYPLVLPKAQFPDSLSLELIWRIGGVNGYSLRHELSIEFSKERMTGNFYTSHQRLVQSSEVPHLKLVSFFPDDSEYLFNRKAHYEKIASKHPILKETAKLTPIPMELSYNPHL